MSKPIKVTLAVVSVLAIVGLLCWGLGRDTQEGSCEKLRARIEHAVLDYNTQQDMELTLANQSAGAAERSRLEQEYRGCVMRSLGTGDNLFWKPYTLIRTNLPAFFSNWLPQWREPRKVRRAAAWWLSNRAERWNATPAPLGLNQLAAPKLCRLAKHDLDPEVRQASTWALGNIGIFSENSFSIMTGALTHAETADRRAAVRWFGKNRLVPERIVPVLVRGLEDDAMRSDYAEGLRAYGSLADFAVEPLIVLAQTNNRATASVAFWALEAIDPGAAARAGVK